MNRQQLETEVISSLSSLFDLDKASIHMSSKLYEDLDLDSIDAVDLVVHLQKMTGKKINPEEFKSVRSVEDIVLAIEKMLSE